MIMNYKVRGTGKAQKMLEKNKFKIAVRYSSRII